MIARRIISIGILIITSTALTLLLPIALIILSLYDAITRSRGARTRAFLFIEVFLVMELLGVLISIAIWIADLVNRDSAQFESRNYQLQNWWGVTIARMAIRIYNLSFNIENDFEKTETPFILFMRHTSFVDTFLPIFLVSSKFDIRLLYILKQELLWDPCLNIVGNRIPNVFLRRGSGNFEAQAIELRRLAEKLNTTEGVVIFPEGTRFTKEKQKRILEKANQEGEREYQRVVQFESVLPPHAGGAIALLEAAPRADAVFCSHAGLESTVSFGKLWKGDLIDTPIHIRFDRVSSTDIPLEYSARAKWLDQEWLKVDEIVTEYNSQILRDQES